eukprot:4835807-Heterocapsa_arctica.AAC.1
MGAARSTIVFCGDSSKKSYALSATHATADDIASADQHLERWRFVDVEEPEGDPTATPLRAW